VRKIFQTQDDLDSPHLHGDGGLGEVQFLGRPGKRQVASNGLKYPELAERESAHQYISKKI
jgi:hypothetical protein